MSAIALFLNRIEIDLQAADRRLPNANLRSTWVRELQQANTRARTLLTLKQQLTADTHLSQEGKRQRFTELAAKERRDWTSLETTRGNIKTNIAQRRAALFALPPLPDGNEIIHYLRQQELRTALRTLSTSERAVKLQTAIAQQDGVMLRAMLEDPLGQLADRTLVERMQRDHLEKAKPAEFRELQELEQLGEHLDSLAVHANLMFENVGNAA